MPIIKIINKKKQGYELSKKEINYIVHGYTKGLIPDYQMSALLMSIYFNNMTDKESSLLTEAMTNSGKILDPHIKDSRMIDKHSTGGVGDKVSILLLPLIASMNVPIVKMSGRGLGFTGGTIDKLESIKGFRTNLSQEEIESSLDKSGIALIGQTDNVAPADKKLYALRDVTGTVDSIPLIASSIMSKKIATGIDGLVLDIKVGSGAFMKSIVEAEKLAKTMINIGKSFNKDVVAILSSMDEPLGQNIGNILEVQEVSQTLKNEFRDEKLLELTLEIATQMLKMTSKYSTHSKSSIKNQLNQNIIDGTAHKTFIKWIKGQGGDIEDIDRISYKYEYIIKSEKDGIINDIDTQKIGEIVARLGAGRAKLNDEIDRNAGIKVYKKLGDKVEKDEVLLTGMTNMGYSIELEEELRQTIEICDKQESVNKNIILKIIE